MSNGSSPEKTRFSYKPFKFDFNISNNETGTERMIAAADKIRSNTELLKEQNKKLEEQNKELEDKAYLDTLTGIPNRRSFTEDLENLNAEKDKINITIFYFDLNLLKKINDTISHKAGDKQVQKMADLLQTVFFSVDGKAYRDSDGDEFAGIIKNDSVNMVLQKLKEGTEIINKNNPQDMPLSFADGFARFDRSLGDKTLFDTKDRADKNMLLKKEQMKLEDPSLVR
jgi:diguanylate cyclase (GGDEF)-like protein